MATFTIANATPTAGGIIRLSSSLGYSLVDGFEVYVGNRLIGTNGKYDSIRNRITVTTTIYYERYLFLSTTLTLTEKEVAADTIEWRQMSREETIDVTSRTEYVARLYTDQTETVNGTPGVRTYTWEEKFVNGVTTNEKRNERSSITKHMVQTLHYVGTTTRPPADTIEWRSMSREETIAVTSRTENTDRLEIGNQEIIQGTPGIRTYTWEERFLNGASTGEKRNQQSSVTKQMIQTVIYKGTKQPSSPSPQPPITDGDFFKIGNLTKVSNGLFKGTFDIRALSKIKFVSNGLVITNAAMYDVDNVDTWFRAEEDFDIALEAKADNELTQEQLTMLQEQANLMQSELDAKATLAEAERWWAAFQEFQKSNAKQAEESERELIEASRRMIAIENNLGDTKERWSFLDRYMDATEEGIVIGKKDGSSTIKINDGRISMVSAGKEVMYITQGVIHIDNGVFTKTLQVGYFRTEQYENNPYMNVIRFVGG